MQTISTGLVVFVLKVDLRRGADSNGRVRFSYEKILKPFGVPVKTSRGVFPLRESLLLRLEDTRGNVADGECAPWPGFGCESLAEAEIFLKNCAGEVPSRIPAAFPCVAHAFSSAKFFLENPSEISAPENKLCAKLIRRLPEDSPAGISEKIAREYEFGFRVFKIKIGLGEAKNEFRFCEKILSEIPAGTRIRFDANGAFSEEILPCAAELSAFPGLEFFEQPLPPSPENDAKIFAAAETLGAKFALDESVREPWNFPEGTGVVAVVKPLLISDFPKLLSWLENPRGADVVISTVFENSSAGTLVLRAACARLAANRRRAFGLG